MLTLPNQLRYRRRAGCHCLDNCPRWISRNSKLHVLFSGWLYSICSCHLPWCSRRLVSSNPNEEKNSSIAIEISWDLEANLANYDIICWINYIFIVLNTLWMFYSIINLIFYQTRTSFYLSDSNYWFQMISNYKPNKL